MTPKQLKTRLKQSKYWLVINDEFDPDPWVVELVEELPLSNPTRYLIWKSYRYTLGIKAQSTKEGRTMLLCSWIYHPLNKSQYQVLARLCS